MRFTHRARLLLASVFLATGVVAGVLAVDPPAAEAAGGNVKRCGGGKIHLNADEKRNFGLHNKARRNHNLRPLCVHPTLQKAARAHSADMMRRDYFSHETQGRNESSCERIRRYGYRWTDCGENIAWGSGTLGDPDSIMRDWMQSDGHRRNILNGKFREIGIGTANGTFNGHRNATMYTADFGSRRR